MTHSRWGAALLGLTLVSAAAGRAWDDDEEDRPRFPEHPTFTTLIKTPLAIEGLTTDDAGNLYTTGRAVAPATRCPVWRISVASPSLDQIGSIPNTPAACNPSGTAFDGEGNLHVADGGQGVVWRLTPSDMNPTVPFGTGVPGTNGLAFGGDGSLWTGDGTTGQGRVWKIAPSGGAGVLQFRIQPLANDVNVVAGAGGVGRDARTLPPGKVTFPGRAAADTAGSQPLVANGLAFDRRGDLFVADTGRGAIWKVDFDRHGQLRSRTGCDTTFTADTPCLENVFVAHPLLEGTDGIAFDRAGNLWNSANERNAIVVVTVDRRVVEVFRNPPDPVTRLRNGGPLEFPTSPVLMGRTLCTANSDGNRRDNSPNSAGEVGPAPAADRGKISCLDQELSVPGLRLPVR